ncbi:MAG: MerC domain-containing protein [Planctomycetes bacterium]|nr:MerC domain-containing protein [Planctomycetota bacterium]
MATVELIYDNDCPNVDDAKAQLRRAFAEVALPPRWDEWDRHDPASPPHVRTYVSPTILVDGKDVAGVSQSDGADCCRLYTDGAGRLQGVPSVETIASALRSSASSVAGNGSTQAGGSRSGLAVLPAAIVALLPNVTCPACWSAYAGLLSSMGLGFLTKTTYLLPLTVIFLAVAVGSLGFRAQRHRGYAPFILGLLAATLVLVGKFALEFDPALYGGIAALVAASLWNSWPNKVDGSVPCPSCTPTGRLNQIESTQKF